MREFPGEMISYERPEGRLEVLRETGKNTRKKNKIEDSIGAYLHTLFHVFSPIFFPANQSGEKVKKLGEKNVDKISEV